MYKEKITSFYNKYKILLNSFALSLIIILIVLLLIPKNKAEKSEINKVSINEEKTEETAEEYYYIDIKGYVNIPGVYKLLKNSRVIDAINMAGGLLENASTKYINLSKLISDEMTIIIYSNEEIENFKEKEIITLPCSCENIVNDSCIENIKNKSQEKININSASLEQLITLTGIGEAKANSIIEYRKSKTFEKVEEIKEVSGISDAIYDKIKDLIITE